MTRRSHEARQPIWSSRATESTKGEQVGVLEMFPHEVRCVRAARLDLQVLRARKIESGARHARREATAFEWRRNFGVINHKFAGRAVVIDQTECIANPQFEALQRNVVKNVGCVRGLRIRHTDRLLRRPVTATCLMAAIPSSLWAGFAKTIVPARRAPSPQPDRVGSRRNIASEKRRRFPWA